MAKALKKCRVCGKDYEYCHTFRTTDNLFRWQDVACSPECGAIYFAKIQASRACNNSDMPLREDVEDIDEMEDSWFDEDFSDEDDEDIL